LWAQYPAKNSWAGSSSMSPGMVDIRPVRVRRFLCANTLFGLLRVFRPPFAFNILSFYIFSWFDWCPPFLFLAKCSSGPLAAPFSLQRSNAVTKPFCPCAVFLPPSGPLPIVCGNNLLSRAALLLCPPPSFDFYFLIDLEPSYPTVRIINFLFFWFLGRVLSASAALLAQPFNKKSLLCFFNPVACSVSFV